MDVTIGGTQLYYEEAGPSTGKPLLLLHAALQTGASMAPLRDLFVPEGFRVVAPDQRGHGQTGNPFPGISIDQMADDMVALMAALGLERPVVIGYSLGGIVALELARRGLLSGLVVMASRIQSTESAQRAFDPGDIRRRSPLWAEQLTAKHVATPWPELAVAIGAMLQSWPGFSPHDLGQIACPTLVIQGDRDQMVPVEQAHKLAAAVPGARLQIVPRAGHPELLYRTDATRAVSGFVGEITSTGVRQ